jgi:hypothetical protein
MIVIKCQFKNKLIVGFQVIMMESCFISFKSFLHLHKLRFRGDQAYAFVATTDQFTGASKAPLKLSTVNKTRIQFWKIPIDQHYGLPSSPRLFTSFSIPEVGSNNKTIHLPVL